MTANNIFCLDKIMQFFIKMFEACFVFFFVGWWIDVLEAKKSEYTIFFH